MLFSSVLGLLRKKEYALRIVEPFTGYCQNKGLDEDSLMFSCYPIPLILLYIL